MIKHLEIEYKTLIDKNTYEILLKKFELETKTFVQTNYYFDTKNHDLMNKKTVLRIRKKDQYKLTKKEKSDEGNQETSIYLTDSEAINMIKNGFDAKIINEPYNVHVITSLTTTRAKKPYKDGTIFFDKSEYNGHTDYELEFEANDLKIGHETWLKFLKEFNIEQKNPISKSERAFNSIKK